MHESSCNVGHDCPIFTPNNQPMQTILVEDNAESREQLKFLLEKYAPECQIIAIATSGKEAVTAIETHHPELVFLDIELGDLNAFEVLERLQFTDFHLIFTTAFDKYAIRAIRFNALDYLLKPFGREELLQSLARLSDRTTRLQTAQIENLPTQFTDTSKLTKLAIPTTEGLVFRPIVDILYCESDRNYTTLFFMNGEKILVSRPLREYEDLLRGGTFFRIHNSFLVNVNGISKYVRGDGGYVVLQNGVTLNVARNRKDDFLKIWK